MPAQRIFNLFAAMTGTAVTGGTPTQIVGPKSLSITHGHRRIRADESDGLVGTPAQDPGPFFVEGALECADISSFMSQLALWEASAVGRAILAEGREVGAATVTDLLWKRAKLTGASLSLVSNQYATCRYNLRSSCDPASNSQDDEISFTAGQSKTATIGSGKRTYRIVSSIHAGTDQAFACEGIELNVQGNAQVAAGDDDFGETVEVGPYDVSGRVLFKDYTVASLLAKAQTLIAAARGAFVNVLKQQGGGANTTLTLANTKFFDVADQFRSGDYWMASLTFGCEFVSGTTPYALATGSNKVITMA